MLGVDYNIQWSYFLGVNIPDHCYNIVHEGGFDLPMDWHYSLIDESHLMNIISKLSVHKLHHWYARSQQLEKLSAFFKMCTKELEGDVEVDGINIIFIGQVLTKLVNTFQGSNKLGQTSHLTKY